VKKSAGKWFASLNAYGQILLSRNVATLVLLLLLVEVSAMSVIYSTYRSRALFAELENLRNDAEEMQVAWSQLLLEQSTLASFSRVVEVSQRQLNMKVPDSQSIIVLQQP
jgi:cell division protein FtsL